MIFAVLSATNHPLSQRICLKITFEAGQASYNLKARFQHSHRTTETLAIVYTSKTKKCTAQPENRYCCFDLLDCSYCD